MIALPAFPTCSFNPVCPGCQWVLKSVWTGPPPGRAETVFSKASDAAAEPPSTSSTPPPPACATTLASPGSRTTNRSSARRRGASGADCADEAASRLTRAPRTSPAAPPIAALSTCLRVGARWTSTVPVSLGFLPYRDPSPKLGVAQPLGGAGNGQDGRDQAASGPCPFRGASVHNGALACVRRN